MAYKYGRTFMRKGSRVQYRYPGKVLVYANSKKPVRKSYKRW